MEFDGVVGPLSYILNTEFDQRMEDIYIGMAGEGPPFFDSLLFESMQTQSLILLNTHGHLWTESEWISLNHHITYDYDIFSIQAVLDRVALYPDGNVKENLSKYLFRNHLSVLLRKHLFTSSRNASIINPAVGEVW